MQRDIYLLRIGSCGGHVSAISWSDSVHGRKKILNEPQIIFLFPRLYVMLVKEYLNFYITVQRPLSTIWKPMWAFDMIQCVVLVYRGRIHSRRYSSPGLCREAELALFVKKCRTLFKTSGDFYMTTSSWMCMILLLHMRISGEKNVWIFSCGN